jgi:hypothetical protein
MMRLCVLFTGSHGMFCLVLYDRKGVVLLPPRGCLVIVAWNGCINCSYSSARLAWVDSRLGFLFLCGYFLYRFFGPCFTGRRQAAVLDPTLINIMYHVQYRDEARSVLIEGRDAQIILRPA